MTPRLLTKCGSCSSLVLSYCRPMWFLLPEHRTIDAELAHLALGPILIDTTNLQAPERTHAVDVAAVELAESKLTTATQEGGDIYDRTAYFDAITALKEDISSLSPRDVLRKDYKRWADSDAPGSLALGISSIVQGLTYLTSSESRFGSTGGFLDAVRAWAREQGLDVVAVMTVSKPEGVFTRELMVWGFGEEAVAAGREFARRCGERLGLERWRGGEMEVEGEGEWRGCWTQGRREFSRKQVAPMLREVMRGEAKL